MQKRFLKFSLFVSCSIISVSAITNASGYDASGQPSVEIDFDALSKFKPAPAPVAMPVPAMSAEPIAEPKRSKKKVAARRGSPKWSETPLSMQNKSAETEAASAPEPSTQSQKPHKKTAVRKRPAHKPVLAKNVPAIVVTPAPAMPVEPVKPIEAQNIVAPEAPIVETPVQPQPPSAVPGYIANPPSPSPMAPNAQPAPAVVPSPTDAPAVPAPNADATQNAPAPAAPPVPEAIVAEPVVTQPGEPKPSAVPAQPSAEPQGFMDKIKNFFTGDKSAPAPAPVPAPGDVQPPQAIAAPTPPVTVANANPAPMPAPASVTVPATETNVATLTPPPPAAVAPQLAPVNNEPPKGLLTRLEYQQNATDIPNSAVLDQLASQMQASSGQRITITSYATTNDGQSSTARRTSLKRALMVRKYLIDKGVDGARINVQAMGDSSAGQPQDRVDISQTGNS